MPEATGARSRAGGAREFSIAADGTWLHRGTAIRREALVRLLAGMLRRDGEGYVLEAPGQRVRVEVEDAPFLAVDADTDGEGASRRIVFLTNLGERVEAGPQHPLVLRRHRATGEHRLYLVLRDGLEALVARHVFYRLAGLAEEPPDGGSPGIRSGGAFFPLA